MKTLLLLIALATAATAAPTVNDIEFVSKKGAPFRANSLGSIKREKKSPTDIAEPSQIIEDMVIESAPETSARTIHLKKKPIVIRNNLGHHRLYRDSEEERSDSTEKCTKEVTVKLCHAGNDAKLTKEKDSSDVTVDEHSKPDNEMEQSIKLAKEAVENLQRDLLVMKQNSGVKSSHWKHTDPEADAEIDADLEAARQALEHIHQSFGNLESMNLRSTTLQDAEALQDAHKQLVETDDERIAKWKEVMSNIQNNVDTAKDTEDSIIIEKSAPLLSADSLVNADNSEITVPFNENLMKSADTSQFDAVNEETEMSSSLPLPKETNLELTIEEKSTDNVNLADSAPKSSENQFKTIDLSSVDEDNFGKKTNSEEAREGNNSELNSIVTSTNDAVENLNDNTQVMLDEEKPSLLFDKEADNKEEITNLEKQRAAEEIPEDNHVEGTKTLPVEERSTHLTEPSESTNVLSEKAVIDTATLIKRNEDSLPKNTEENLAENIENPIVNNEGDDLMKNVKNSIMKIAEEEELKQNTENPESNVKNHETMGMALKSVDHDIEADNGINSEHDELPKLADTSISENKPMDMLESPSTNSETVMTIKAAEPEALTLENAIPTAVNLVKKPIENVLAVANLGNLPKSTDHMDIKTPTESLNPINLLKSADNTQSKAPMEPTNQMHLTPDNNIARSNINTMPHGKPFNTENTVRPSTPSHTDLSGKSVLERHNMLQWKDHTARGAYGIYGPAHGALGGGGFGGAAAHRIGGAVGVFPNAKVGGCAIPLLLSCSPSVVSGSLAKAAHGPAYGAPAAYRMGDSFKYHKKRDITNILARKGKRSPTKVIQRIPLSKKL